MFSGISFCYAILLRPREEEKSFAKMDSWVG